VRRAFEPVFGAELSGPATASQSSPVTVQTVEFQYVVRRRRMVRDFSDEPVARPLVEQLMNNATRIPSAGFSQGFAFVVLTDPVQRRLFWETTSGPDWRGESETASLTRAPVVIVPLAHKQAYLERYALPDKVHTPLSREEFWPAPYWDIDAGFGVMLVLLTAVDLGLGALFFGIFRGEKALMDALGVPAGYRPIGAIAVGHPTAGERSEPELPTGRRRRDEVVRWERW
jgi:nitroreductase